MSDLNSLMNPSPEDEYVDHDNDNDTTTAGGSGNSATTDSNTVQAPTSDEFEEQDIIKNFEKIKTHFPAARIKKIMQSDEDIGKVAQATPIVVGRALEIFMTNLLQVSIKQAKQNGAKRINASHIRSAVENTEQFDFLMDAVDKYPPLKQ